MSSFLSPGQNNTGTSAFSGIFPDGNSPQQSQQPGIHPQQINPGAPSNFSSRLVNSFGIAAPIQQTFEKFSPLQNKNVFTRQPQGGVNSQGQGPSFYRVNNFNCNNAVPQSSYAPHGGSQFRISSDSPNYIQLAAEKVASFLNPESVPFKNPFGTNFFANQPNSGLQRSFLSRTTGNISGSLGTSTEPPLKVAPSLSMGLTNPHLAAQMQTNQPFVQTAQTAQPNPNVYYQPMAMQSTPTHASNVNQLQLQNSQAARSQLETGNQWLGMGQPTLQTQNPQFQRKPQTILAPPAPPYSNQPIQSQGYVAPFQPAQVTGFAPNIQGGIPGTQLDADQRFRRSKDLFQQSQNSKLNQNPGLMGMPVNTGVADPVHKFNLIQPTMGHLNNAMSGSYQSVYSDSQLNQAYGFQNHAVPGSGASILGPNDAVQGLQRQQMFVSMDGGLNLIGQQKNNELQFQQQQQSLYNSLDRSRALDRLSIEQLYNQTRSRSLDQSDVLGSPGLVGAAAGPTTPNVPPSQLSKTRFPQFPVDLAHRLHAQHATGYQIPAEFNKRPLLDSSYGRNADQMLKSTLDASVQPKSVSFSVNQGPQTSVGASSLTKLSELFPDCAECRRLEENRRLYRASLKLRRNPSESWSDYMKENDRFISSQDEDSLRKLAKMVSATFSGDSDSADSEGRFTRGFGNSSSDYPYTARYPESVNKLGQGFGSVRSLPSSYVDQLESTLVRGSLDSPGSLRSRKTTSLSEVDMQRRLELERDLYRPNRNRTPSHDYLVNTEYAKAAAYAAELNQKLGAFTAEMENLSLDRTKLRGRSRDRKNEKERRMSSRDGGARERSKSRTLEDVSGGARLRSASPEHAKQNRRLDRIGKSARDYSPVGVSGIGAYGDGYANDGFGSMTRSRNRSTSKTRINYDDPQDSYSSSARRRLNSYKDRNVFAEDDVRKKPRDKSRESHSRRGSFYESRPFERRHGQRDVESSSSSIDRLSSPDRRNRKAGASQINQNYEFQRGSRERSSRDRNYERTLDVDKNRKLPDVPGNNYSNESGYSSQSQRATRDDNERYARNNSSNHRDNYKSGNDGTHRDNRGYQEDEYYNDSQQMHLSGRPQKYGSGYQDSSIRNAEMGSEYGGMDSYGNHGGSGNYNDMGCNSQGQQHQNMYPNAPSNQHGTQQNFYSSNSGNNSMGQGTQPQSQQQGHSSMSYSNQGRNNVTPNQSSIHDPTFNNQRRTNNLPGHELNSNPQFNNPNSIYPQSASFPKGNVAANRSNNSAGVPQGSFANTRNDLQNSPNPIMGAGHQSFLQNERQMLREQAQRSENYINDGIVPDDTKDFVKSTVNKTKQLIDEKFSRAFRLCEQNLDNNTRLNILSGYANFEQFWQDILDEVSSLHEDYNLIEQLRTNNWTPSDSSFNQSQFRDFENEDGYMDDYEDNSPNFTQYPSSTSNGTLPQSDSHPIVPGKLRKNVVKVPKRPRPLTTTAASRALQEAKKRHQTSSRK